MAILTLILHPNHSFTQQQPPPTCLTRMTSGGYVGEAAAGGGEELQWKQWKTFTHHYKIIKKKHTSETEVQESKQTEMSHLRQKLPIFITFLPVFCFLLRHFLRHSIQNRSRL